VFSRHDSDNFAVVILAFIAECIVGCIEQLLQYFNQYAFAQVLAVLASCLRLLVFRLFIYSCKMQVAIYGKSYCRAAKDTWNMIHSHGIQAIINDNIIGSVLSLACLASAVVTGIVGGVMIYILEDDYYIPVGIISGLVRCSSVNIVLNHSYTHSKQLVDWLCPCDASVGSGGKCGYNDFRVLCRAAGSSSEKLSCTL